MISVIICTYNRPLKVVELISFLLQQTEVPDEILVVDSSDNANQVLDNHENVTYLRSSHKNQPYQRYIGYLAAKYDWLLFLDDDMEPENANVIKSIKSLRKEISDVVAFAIRFENLHENTSFASIPKSKIKKGKGKIACFFRWFTGYPILNQGKVGWNGVRGIQPRGGFTEWFSGGAFLTKREVIFQNFNFGLFTLFEKRIGMGEDFIIAYSIAQQGKIWATKEIFFYHNDQGNSTYTINVKSFNRRAIYSRLYLTLEKARLTNSSKVLAIIRYLYYCIWRGIGLIINLILNPTKRRTDAFHGFISGFLKSHELIRMNIEEHRMYWVTEARKD